MDFLQEFNRLMKDTPCVAVATSVDNAPNVRMTNFYYDANKKGVIYFSTFKGSAKAKEFLLNNKVSFTTVPVGTHEHIRVNNGIVKESDLKLSELMEMYATKYPGIEKIPQGDMIGVYEIHFSEAEVTLGVTQRSKVTL